MIGSAVSEPPEPASFTSFEVIGILHRLAGLLSIVAGARSREELTVQGIFFQRLAGFEILPDNDILVCQAGGAFQQAGMEVENITRVGFTTRRAAQEQGNLSICPGMLGKIIIDHQRIAPGFHELFADGAPGIRSNVLQRSGFIRSRDHNDGVFHGSVPFEQCHCAGNGGFFLTDGHIDADQILAFLVDDRVDGDGGLASLAVADDQFSLAAADGDHRVDGFDTGLDGSIHILALHHTRGNALDRPESAGLDRTFAIHRFSQDIHHPPDQPIAHRDRGDASGGAHGHAFGYPGIFTHDDDTNGVLFQVEGNAHHAVGKLDQFLGFDVRQAGDPGDTIACLQYGTNICNTIFRLERIRSVSVNRWKSVLRGLPLSLPAYKCRFKSYTWNTE